MLSFWHKLLIQLMHVVSKPTVPNLLLPKKAWRSPGSTLPCHSTKQNPPGILRFYCNNVCIIECMSTFNVWFGFLVFTVSLNSPKGKSLVAQAVGSRYQLGGLILKSASIFYKMGWKLSHQKLKFSFLFAIFCLLVQNSAQGACYPCKSPHTVGDLLTVSLWKVSKLMDNHNVDTRMHKHRLKTKAYTNNS